MKFKSLLFVACFSLLSSVYADNRHLHPNMNVANLKPADKKLMSPGNCEIEIRNVSNDNVVVSGQFDDGTTLTPFYVYSYESPHYISLYYPDYYGNYFCHRDMYLTIDTFRGYRVYAGYARVDTTITVVPYLQNQLKAEIHAKK